VSVSGREEFIQFLIFEKLSQDILLALDYLILTNAYVIPERQSIVVIEPSVLDTMDKDSVNIVADNTDDIDKITLKFEDISEQPVDTPAFLLEISILPKNVGPWYIQNDVGTRDCLATPTDRAYLRYLIEI
jgi:hypothetical protein